MFFYDKNEKFSKLCSKINVYHLKLQFWEKYLYINELYIRLIVKKRGGEVT